MIKLISQWYKNNFSNPQSAILSLILIIVIAAIYFFGNILVPMFASIILAYLLNGITNKIESIYKINHNILLIIVFTSFLSLIIFSLVMLLPAVMYQLTNFVSKVPGYASTTQTELTKLIASQPDIFNHSLFADIGKNFSELITNFTKEVVTESFSFLPNLVSFLIYLIMVPMLTWFLLSDKDMMIKALNSLVPTDHSLTKKVWHDVDLQLGNYIFGKIIEIITVGIVTYLGFLIFDLQFALLLAVLVGFSVLIPYIGITVVSIPVILVAFSQFGLSSELVYLLIVFFIIQALDAFVLVPILFAKAINMHPVAIIIAILFFGGLWGFWGLFFAIPLAVLIHAIILVWPKQNMDI